MSDTFKAYSFVRTPAQGGLAASNRPNPYGLRAYLKDDGSYGGEMLPKDIGWLGELQGQGELSGQVMTEYSLEDDKGSYPSIVPTLLPEELDLVLKGIITPTIEEKARAFRDEQVKKGLSPFYNSLGNK